MYLSIEAYFTGTQKQAQDIVYELNWLIKDERFNFQICKSSIDFWGNELCQDTIVDCTISGQVTQLEIERFNLDQDFIIMTPND